MNREYSGLFFKSCVATVEVTDLLWIHNDGNQSHRHEFHTPRVTNQGIHKSQSGKDKKCSERILQELIFTSFEGDHYSMSWWTLNPPVILKKTLAVWKFSQCHEPRFCLQAIWCCSSSWDLCHQFFWLTVERGQIRVEWLRWPFKDMIYQTFLDFRWPFPFVQVSLVHWFSHLSVILYIRTLFMPRLYRLLKKTFKLYGKKFIVSIISQPLMCLWNS